MLGIVQIAGLATGGGDPLHPIEKLSLRAGRQLQFTQIKCRDLAANFANAGGKTVMPNVYADSACLVKA